MRHDSQRFMGKTVYVTHFNRDTVEFHITESDLENFQDRILPLDACFWLHKEISISLSRFGDDFRRLFPASQKILGTV